MEGKRRERRGMKREGLWASEGRAKETEGASEAQQSGHTERKGQMNRESKHDETDYS